MIFTLPAFYISYLGIAIIPMRTKKRKQHNREMEYEEDFYDEAV